MAVYVNLPTHVVVESEGQTVQSSGAQDPNSWHTDVKFRPGHYRRKRDGLTVIAGDWPDGDVSWMLSPLMAVALGGYIAGTCSAKTFAKNHELVTPSPSPTSSPHSDKQEE